MNNSIYTERLIFWQLLDKIDKIEIPIIQRDYAQGRTNQKNIRKKFLKSIKSAFDNKHIELDFIYGNISNGIFKPLDGQQRLTTLFLIHWYIANKSNIINDIIIKKLHKFSYQTRISSGDFCNSLISNTINFSKLLVESDEKNNSLSKTIKNSSWFFIAWEKDPTISAMLNMLDDIHILFQNEKEEIIKEYWEKLTNITKPILTFEFINLENFGLSDDLYIKMNARGKLLTPFENFKASFVKKIKDEKWEEDNNLINSFSHKADTEWADLFWNKNNINMFDISYIRYIAYTLIISLAKKTNPKKNKVLRKIFNNPNAITVEEYDKNSYDFLYNSLTVYSIISKHTEKYDLLYFKFPFWQYLDTKKDTFFSIIHDKKKLTYHQIILFYAQITYLLKNNDFTKAYFNDWMRIVRNIIHNSTIDSADSFIGAINLVSELSKGSNDIYTFLSNKNIKSKFASKQINEEKIKAQIINNIENKNIIHNLEDTFFCEGRISFILDCIDYKESKSFDRQKIIQLTDIINKHLSKKDFSNEFRSALLTIKDNNYYDYWKSWLHAVNSRKRCLIEHTYELRDLVNNNNFIKVHIKILLNKLTTCSLETIRNNFKQPENMPNWKIRLIKEPNLLDFSKRHFFAIKEDDSCCYLIPQSKVANSDKGKKRLKEIK